MNIWWTAALTDGLTLGLMAGEQGKGRRDKLCVTGVGWEGRERAAQTSLHLCKVGQKVDIFSFINHLSGSVAQVDTAKTTGKWPPSPLSHKCCEGWPNFHGAGPLLITQMAKSSGSWVNVNMQVNIKQNASEYKWICIHMKRVFQE